MLARALGSVVLQTFRDYEVRVYDNASDDDTAEVVAGFAKHHPQIHYFRHEQNIGSERNFQFGLERVETELVCFLSDDDLLLPRFYELAVAALDEHPTAAMASTGVIHANPAGALALEPSLRAGLHEPPDGLAEMLELNQPAWTGTIFRRAAVEAAGGLDEASVIDLDLQLRLAAQRPYVVIAAPGAILTTGNHFAKCLDWAPRFHVTEVKLEDDERIPISVRRLVRPDLERRLHSMVYETGIVAARMGKVDIARKASRVLTREFRDKRGAAIVYAAGNLGRLAPVVAPAYRALRSRRRTQHDGVQLPPEIKRLLTA